MLEFSARLADKILKMSSELEKYEMEYLRIYENVKVVYGPPVDQRRIGENPWDSFV